tara:strand:+ start:265 stop:462 length:198 start_codon:yes stop_codon:yes gene_type:complete
MKSFQIAFYLDFIAGLVIIGFALIQAIKNVKDWINVTGAFKEFLFQILIISLLVLFVWGIAKFII